MANPILQKLAAWGCDIRSAMERMMGNESLFLMLLPEAVGDESFKKLYEALQNGDLRAAFENAHQIKGFVGNMGLTPMYEIDCVIVETLRREALPKYDELVTLIKSGAVAGDIAIERLGEAIEADDLNLLVQPDHVVSDEAHQKALDLVHELNALIKKANLKCDELMRFRDQLCALLAENPQ